MLYIIENLLCFRADDGAFWAKDAEEDILVLSPIVARLFHLFIEAQGKLLTRDEIMHEVWEKHGLEPSNNSLNQYVSQLRKLLTQFQMPDDSIRTVPREGFILKNELIIKTVREETSKNSTSLDEEVATLVIKPELPAMIVLSICLILALILAPVGVVYYTDVLHKQRMSIKPEKIGVVGNCPVYSILMGRNAKLSETLSSAKHYIEQNSISCNDENIVYFFATGGMLKNQGGRAFLSHCQRKDNEIIACLDYTYHTWK